MRRTLVPFIAALCLFAVPALAEELTHVESGLRRSIRQKDKDGWSF